MEAVVWHRESHSEAFCPYIFYLQVFIAKSLVWFKSSDFCYTINTRSSLGLLLESGLFSHVAVNKATSAVLPKQAAGPAFPSAATGKGNG